MNWDWEKLKEEHDKEKEKPKSEKKKRSSWLRPVHIFMIIVGIVTSFFLLWSLVGWFDDTYSYKNKIQQEIIEMVKQDALKDKYKNSIKKKLLIDE